MKPWPSPLSAGVGQPGKPFGALRCQNHPSESNCPLPWLIFGENHGAIRAISADRLKVKGRARVGAWDSAWGILVGPWEKIQPPHLPGKILFGEQRRWSRTPGEGGSQVAH